MNKMMLFHPKNSREEKRRDQILGRFVLGFGKVNIPPSPTLARCEITRQFYARGPYIHHAKLSVH